VAKLEGTARARAIHDLPAKVLGVQLRGPKRGERTPLVSKARDDVGLGEKGAVDCECSVVKPEYGLLRLHVDRKFWG